jgi:hypothetical protein
MNSNKQSKLEFWRAHVAGAEQFPAGVGAYCAEQSLPLSTYYGWRKLVKPASLSPKPHKFKRLKKERPTFLPVAVTAGQVEVEQTYKSMPRLPEARWVAEVLLHLARGLA